MIFQDYAVILVRITWALAILLLLLKNFVPFLENISKYGKLEKNGAVRSFFFLRIDRKNTFTFAYVVGFISTPLIPLILEYTRHILMDERWELLISSLFSRLIHDNQFIMAEYSRISKIASYSFLFIKYMWVEDFTNVFTFINSAI